MTYPETGTLPFGLPHDSARAVTVHGLSGDMDDLICRSIQELHNRGTRIVRSGYMVAREST